MAILGETTRIICLANSFKHTERCIAGIDLVTGKCVRPVSDLDDGRVPQKIRLIDGKEPDKFISPKYLASLPPEKRITLQLVETEKFSVKPQPRDIGGDQWLGSFKAKNGVSLNNISVTDPIYFR